MKKPSRRSCTVCPKNKHHDDSDDEEHEVISSRNVSKRHSRKNNRFRNNRRTTNRNVIHRMDAKKKAARIAATRRANVKAAMARKRAKPRSLPPRTIRPLAIKSNNQYYGLDHQTEVPHPRTGDTFTNMITGEVRIHNKGVWNLIPTPVGPRSYYSQGIPRDDLIPEPKDGDLHIHAINNQISIFQNGEWNDQNFLSTDNQIVTKSTVEEKIEGKMKISLPLRHHNLNEDVNQTSETTKQSFKLNFKKNLALLEGTYLNLSTFDKIFPSIFNDQAIIQVLPQGVIDVVLTFVDPCYSPIEFDLETWIKYSDTNSNLWQTVTCLADLEVFNSEGQLIEDYQLTANDKNKLVDLNKSITSLAPRETITLKSNLGISRISWKSKLLAYQVNDLNQGPKEFYSVQFNDLKKEINLPKLKIKVNI